MLQKQRQIEKQKGSNLVLLQRDIAFEEVSSFPFILFNDINLLIWLQLVLN